MPKMTREQLMQLEKSVDEKAAKRKAGMENRSAERAVKDASAAQRAAKDQIVRAKKSAAASRIGQNIRAKTTKIERTQPILTDRETILPVR